MWDFVFLIYIQYCNHATVHKEQLAIKNSTYVVRQCNAGSGGSHLQPPRSSVEESIVALCRDVQTILCQYLNIDKIIGWYGGPQKPLDVCGGDIREGGSRVSVSITFFWKCTSEVDEVGNHHVGRLCLIDRVEGLQQLLIALGVGTYVCQCLCCITTGSSSFTVTLHCADKE